MAGHAPTALPRAGRGRRAGRLVGFLWRLFHAAPCRTDTNRQACVPRTGSSQSAVLQIDRGDGARDAPFPVGVIKLSFRPSLRFQCSLVGRVNQLSPSGPDEITAGTVSQSGAAIARASCKRQAETVRDRFSHDRSFTPFMIRSMAKAASSRGCCRAIGPQRVHVAHSDTAMTARHCHKKQATRATY